MFGGGMSPCLWVAQPTILIIRGDKMKPDDISVDVLKKSCISASERGIGMAFSAGIPITYEIGGYILKEYPNGDIVRIGTIKDEEN